MQTLEQALHALLPLGRLQVLTLATVPPLRLQLLADDFPQHELDHPAMLRIMDNPLYWLFCWASGQVLAEVLLADPRWVRGRRVLDFGCGSGVVAIAAALAGASEVIACDHDPLALQATQANAALNGVDLVLSPNFDEVEGRIDLILVADVLYDRENLPWLQRFCRRSQSVLVADSRIRHFDVPSYRWIGSQCSCTLPDLDESAEFRRVNLYCAGRSPDSG
jgi:predicted nicotinamide N-methyase